MHNTYACHWEFEKDKCYTSENGVNKPNDFGLKFIKFCYKQERAMAEMNFCLVLFGPFQVTNAFISQWARTGLHRFFSHTSLQISQKILIEFCKSEKIIMPIETNLNQ